MKTLTLYLIIYLAAAPLTIGLKCYSCDELHCGDMETWEKTECADSNDECVTLSYLIKKKTDTSELSLRSCGTKSECESVLELLSQLSVPGDEMKDGSCKVCSSDYCNNGGSNNAEINNAESNNAFRLGAMELKIMAALATVAVFISS